MTDYVYLDHAAMAPLHPRVAAAIEPWILRRFGNPSAQYRAGKEAAQALEEARKHVADVLNCRQAEVIFTSGGTESINAAVRGIAVAQQFAGLGSHLVVSAIEHHAVLHTCQYLERFGFDTTYVGVDGRGEVSPDAVAAAVRPDTVLVSVMLANNEVGTVQPIAEIARAVRGRADAMRRSIPVHTDAVQAPLWLPLDVDRLGVDALSLSAHKFGGPPGAGVLHLRRGVPFFSQLTGGGQERQRRAGTENVAGVVGTGVALTLAQAEREVNSCRVTRLARRLVEGIRARHPEAEFNGNVESRLPGIVNFSFPEIEGERLVAELDERGIAVSSGAACASVSWEPSHVLLAMGLPLDKAVGAVRFSLGADSTEADIDRALEQLPQAIRAATAAAVS